MRRLVPVAHTEHKSGKPVLTYSNVVLLPLRVMAQRRRFDRSCRWSRAVLEQHQARSLNTLRQFAYRKSPFYRRFHAGLENRGIAGLPILTKAVLMEHFDELVTDPAIRLSELEAFLEDENHPHLFKGRYVVLATSGSTGRRGVFVFNQREWLLALASITRPLAWAGLTPRLFHPKRSAFLASTASWHYSAQVSRSLSNRLLPAMRLDASTPLATMVERLNEWQPEMVGAYPSVLRQLAEEQVRGRLQIPLRHISTSAEVLTHETRQRAMEAWNARVYDTYGATEYAPIAAECQYGRKHLLEDAAFIEITDERGKPVPPGVFGERVLLTVFRRFTQPLIRYEISDRVRLASGDCECGRPFRVVDEIEGRQEDVLLFPGRAGEQVAIHPNVFHDVLERVPAAAWQVSQRDERLMVYLVGLRPHADPGTIAQLVRSRLETEGAVAPLVQVCVVESLRRGLSGKAALIERNSASNPALVP
ncbi:MAG: phenylacetate--CoA ligase family protein [Acidobacteriaceae bacterium]|nr:phenylacetate--CoA ligase family protein [Acidobacteriaceae bacterium]